MIRKLQIKDIDSIVQMEMDNFKETLGKEMLQTEMNNPFVRFRVILNKDQVIGYIGCYFYDEEGEILNFVIDKAYQHQGYGQLLFSALMDELKEDQVKKIILEVKENNEAGLNFYLKNEFTPISKRKHYYQDGSDAIVMMKEFL